MEASAIHKKARQYVKTLREQTFQVHGPQLFNTLPNSVRNTTKNSFDDLKINLDNFLERGCRLETIMDQDQGVTNNSVFEYYLNSWTE